MKLYTVTGQVVSGGTVAEEYRKARAIGNVRVGSGHLFFRARLRVYTLAWNEVTRCYRRVMRVTMKLCCGSGTLDVESLVVEGPSGALASIQLPGTRAARALIEMIRETVPSVDTSVQKKAEKSESQA